MELKLYKFFNKATQETFPAVVVGKDDCLFHLLRVCSRGSNCDFMHKSKLPTVGSYPPGVYDDAFIQGLPKFTSDCWNKLKGDKIVTFFPAGHRSMSNGSSDPKEMKATRVPYNYNKKDDFVTSTTCTTCVECESVSDESLLDVKKAEATNKAVKATVKKVAFEEAVEYVNDVSSEKTKPDEDSDRAEETEPPGKSSVLKMCFSIKEIEAIETTQEHIKEMLKHLNETQLKLETQLIKLKEDVMALNSNSSNKRLNSPWVGPLKSLEWGLDEDSD